MTDTSGTDEKLLDYDNSIANLTQQIADLEKQKQDRIKVLADPKRRELYATYATIADCIAKLNALGENVCGTYDSEYETYADIELHGKTFKYVNGTITES